MQPQVLVAIIQLAVSVSLAAILILIYQRLYKAEFLFSWALFWIAIASILFFSQVSVPIVAGWGPRYLTLRRVLGALAPVIFPLQVSFMVSAAINVTTKITRKMWTWLLTGAIALGLGLGVLQFAANNVVGNLALYRTALTAVAVLVFAYQLEVHGTGTRGRRALVVISLMYAAHNVALGMGVYGSTSYSPSAGTVGILLQFALTLTLAYGAIEHAGRASIEAQESSRRFQGLLQSVGVAGLIVDRAGRVEFCNAYLSKVLDEPVESIVGSQWSDSYVESRDRDAVAAVFQEGIEKGNWPGLHEYTIRSKGRDLTLQWYHTSLRDIHGNIVGVASLGADVTQQRLLETEIHQTQRLETLGRLAGGVAHDFNNHLTVINGFAHLLLERLPEGGQAREQVKYIQSSGKLAATLTSQLLTFSRKRTVESRPVSLNAAVTNITPILRRLIREDIQLDLDLSPAVRSTLADPGQLDHVVLNLVLNASDSISGAGRIVIRTETFLGRPPGAEGPELEYLVLKVQDNGAGMDAWTRQRIFEPFFTTKPEGRGTGLGLATVHGTVVQAGGYIGVKSEVGGGTEFSVYLPAIHSREEAPASPSKTLSTVSRGIVLLVEDQELVRAFAAITLASEGYKVLEASSAREALDLISKTSPDISILVSDVVMPEMSGIELARKINGIYPNLKTLFVSGHAFDNEMDESNLRQSFLPKPYTPAQLCTEVKVLMSGGQRASN